MLIAVISQKGGVGKSSLSRTLAVEFTRSGWNTLLADIDISQVTSNQWAENRRNNKNINPKVNVEVFSMSALAIEKATQYPPQERIQFKTENIKKESLRKN